MNEFVLNGLVKRRAELAGDIERTTKYSERWSWTSKAWTRPLSNLTLTFRSNHQAESLSAAKGLEQSGPDVSESF